MKKIIVAGCLIFVSLVMVYSGERKTYSFNDFGQNNSAQTKNADCSDGWRITGYFTPLESDYNSPERHEIEIAEGGKFTFNEEFLKVVFDENEGFGEGWGKTRFGWYLGNYNGRWHKADAPLDANNSPLETNSVAVDNQVIPTDSIVKIPGLPDDYGTKKFIANDVGVTVHGKHIDVYTGEGKDAEQEMYRITFEDDDLQKVCFQKSE
ncbi:MAG: 3D domain-containing protein [Actinomycetota bacterium]